eukprot:scaffold249271_cov27-Tisochrysis_lutea.AAC.1
MHTCNATDLELKTSQLQQQANNQDGSWSLIMFSVRHQDVVRARHPVSKMWCKQDMENMLRANHAVVKTWCGEDVAYARQGVNRTCLVKTCCCQHVVWSRHCVSETSVVKTHRNTLPHTLSGSCLSAFAP